MVAAAAPDPAPAAMGSASSDVPANAPPACPGTSSEAAGTTDACVGCPNATACASGAGRGSGGADPEALALAARMRQVRHKLLVLSGKGGVGKSTLAAQLAMALAAGGAGGGDGGNDAAAAAGGSDGGDGAAGDGRGGGGEALEVGLLDVDICGPSAPHLLGVSAAEVRQTAGGWEPVYAADNLAVMSIGFMLPASDEAIIWRGARKTGLIRQFLRDVAWGELDYLVVDAPPGTSDEHISLVQALMAKAEPPPVGDGGPDVGAAAAAAAAASTPGVTAAIIVTTPQEVSLLDVRKGLSFCVKAGLPVLGVVENMAGFVCPHCAGCTDIFAPSSGGAAALCAAAGVPLLGRVPLDPALGAAGERGVSAFARAAEGGGSPGVAALRSLVGAIKAAVAAAEAAGGVPAAGAPPG